MSVLQFLLELSDRQAAEAVRCRIDFKDAVGMELDDPGFHHSVLTDFRERLAEDGRADKLFALVLERIEAAGPVTDEWGERYGRAARLGGTPTRPKTRIKDTGDDVYIGVTERTPSPTRAREDLLSALRFAGPVLATLLLPALDLDVPPRQCVLDLIGIQSGLPRQIFRADPVGMLPQDPGDLPGPQLGIPERSAFVLFDDCRQVLTRTADHQALPVVLRVNRMDG